MWDVEVDKGFPDHRASPDGIGLDFSLSPSISVCVKYSKHRIQVQEEETEAPRVFLCS